MTSTTPRIVVIGALVASVLLSGCTPAPTPTPTPTPLFASEDEAFAAAEETYREYTDALNKVDFADSTTFEPVFSLLTGTAAKSTRKAFSQFHAEQTRTSGATRYYSFTGTSADLKTGQVEANVCVDVSAVDVLDASGASIVSADRPAHQPMVVDFLWLPSDARLTISETKGSGAFTCDG